MALLQISEPGASPDPHQRRIAVGIDLGTTNSLVAAVRHGVAECLPDAAGQVILPSAVRYLGDGRRQIGAEALAAQADDPEHTLVSVKRFMGRTLADVADAGKLPYRFVDRPGMLAIETREGVKSPVEVSAEILATLRFRAEDSFDDELFGAVITVPAYFDDAQRQATKDAAELAGLKVLRLINEPTAAAIAYGLDNASEGLYAVYDLGGGTFDISLLRLARGVFEVVATGGDAALGGDDFDRLLADWALAQSGLVASTAQDKRRLLVAARSAKEALTDADETWLTAALEAGELRVRVDRAGFDVVVAPLVTRTLSSVKRVLRDAKLRPADVQGCVMVGGSTRMPCVRAAVNHFFGREVLTNLNPDEVVALGAATQANQLAGNAANGEILLLDVIPLSLGIETAGGATAVIGVALYGLGRQFAARFDAAASRAKVLLPQALRPLDAVDPAAQATGAVPFFTPNSDFYRIDINLSVPNIDPDDWSLRVHGLVDGERRYSYADLLARDLVEADITLTCVSNEVGGRLMGTARWLGVPLQELLDEAGVRPDADYVVGRSFDGFTAGFPLGVLDGRAALLAVGMNGEPLPLIHGFPARLVVPGVYGYSSATKWITEIELTRLDDAPTYWVERGWSVEAPIKTSSRIDTPAGLASVPRGLVAVAGVAWSQPVGISRVEVRVDDGPWERATLAAEVNGSTWRQWSFPWQASAGRHTLTVRATDNNGAIQIEERSEPFPSGVTGWHQIVVLVA